MTNMVLGVIWSAPALAVDANVPNGLYQNSNLGNRLNPPSELPEPPAVNTVDVSTEEQFGSGTVQFDRHEFDGIDGAALPAKTRTAMQTVISRYQGRAVSFGELMQMLDQLKAVLRSQGYLVAQVYLPPKALKGDLLHVGVVPGQFEKAAVATQGKVPRKAIDRIVDKAFSSGKVLDRRSVERLALLLNEIPGVSATLRLEPGEQAGTTQVDVDAVESNRFGGYLGVDNMGLSWGRWRLQGEAYASDLVLSGDRLKLDLIGLPKHNDYALAGQLDYSALINGSGTRAGIRLGNMDYRTDSGSGQYQGDYLGSAVYLSHPWVRQTTAAIDVTAELGREAFNDHYPLPGDNVGKKAVDHASVGLQGAMTMVRGGITGVGLLLTQGQTRYRNALASVVNSADIAQTAGHFTRLNYRFNHEQQIGGNFLLFGDFSGQLAQRNLDASQKMLLGGPLAVRAYDTAAGSVAEGSIFTAELRWKSLRPARAANEEDGDITVAAFYDQGWGRQFIDNHDSAGSTLTRANHVKLSGAGLYVKYAMPKGHYLMATWATRLGEVDPVSGDSGRQRFWVTGVRKF